MTPGEQQVTGILKEKTGAVVPGDAASFVAAVRKLASGSTHRAGER
jgi:hypothetical protein